TTPDSLESPASDPSIIVYTWIEEVEGIEFIVYSSSIEARTKNSFTNLSSGESGVIIYNVTESTNSDWRKTTDYWEGPDDLFPNTTYSFKANSRNQAGVENGETILYATSTLCNTPSTPELLKVHISSVSLKINTNSNTPWTKYSIKVSSTGITKYLQQNNALGDTAVYRDTATWTDNIWVEGLTSNTTYTFSVNAKNSNGVTTTYSLLTTTVTLANPPANAGHDNATQTKVSITWTWDSGGNQKEFYAWTASSDTGWTSSVNWLLGDLGTNTSYLLQVKA
ncbi:unnamed protein product, partial [marine sediment metagenome]